MNQPTPTADDCAQSEGCIFIEDCPFYASCVELLEAIDGVDDNPPGEV